MDTFSHTNFSDKVPFELFRHVSVFGNSTILWRANATNLKCIHYAASTLAVAEKFNLLNSTVQTLDLLDMSGTSEVFRRTASNLYIRMCNKLHQ